VVVVFFTSWCSPLVFYQCVFAKLSTIISIIPDLCVTPLTYLGGVFLLNQACCPNSAEGVLLDHPIIAHGQLPSAYAFWVFRISRSSRADLMLVFVACC